MRILLCHVSSQIEVLQHIHPLSPSSNLALEVSALFSHPYRPLRALRALAVTCEHLATKEMGDYISVKKRKFPFLDVESLSHRRVPHDPESIYRSQKLYTVEAP
jgi:hypothetical protein